VDMRSDPQDLLRKGRALLADPGANAHQLGTALMNIHSALEQHFRISLSQNDRVPLETRANLFRSKEIDWPQLIELMVIYGGLISAQGETIRRFNIVRNGIVHRGETYRGSRRELEQYADLAEALISGRERSFASAEISNPLFDAQMAMLGMDWSPKQPTASDTPWPTVARPSTAQPQPAPVPARSQQGQTAPRQRSYAGNLQGGSRLNRYAVVLFALLIVVLIWWLFNPSGRDRSEPSTPTPTLGLPSEALLQRSLRFLAPDLATT
jgi:hypothetical protein